MLPSWRPEKTRSSSAGSPLSTMSPATPGARPWPDDSMCPTMSPGEVVTNSHQPQASLKGSAMAADCITVVGRMSTLALRQEVDRPLPAPLAAGRRDAGAVGADGEGRRDGPDGHVGDAAERHGVDAPQLVVGGPG